MADASVKKAGSNAYSYQVQSTLWIPLPCTGWICKIMMAFFFLPSTFVSMYHEWNGVLQPAWFQTVYWVIWLMATILILKILEWIQRAKKQSPNKVRNFPRSDKRCTALRDGKTGWFSPFSILTYFSWIGATKPAASNFANNRGEWPVSSNLFIAFRCDWDSISVCDEDNSEQNAVAMRQTSALDTFASPSTIKQKMQET